MPEFITETIDGEAVANWRGIQDAASKYHRARVKVSEYSKEIMESEQQRKWLNGVAIPYLMDKWGRSFYWVKTRLKVYCGEGLFKGRYIQIDTGDKTEKILVLSSENELSIKQAREWIENILDYKPCEEAGLEAPNPEWCKKKQPTPLFED